LTTIETPGKQCSLPGLFCREKTDPGTVEIPEADTSDDAATKAQKSLLCRKCRFPVTNRRHAATVNGSHLHTFFNPAGIIFEIRCFKRADGCAVHGEPTDEFTWFSGYAWRYALCANCLVHLGWIYDSGEKSFFGLIAGRLIEG
jgi:hypothetical protein